MKGFIELTKLRDYGPGQHPRFMKDGLIRINVRGIEHYENYFISTLSGFAYKVAENYDEITDFIENAQFEEAENEE